MTRAKKAWRVVLMASVLVLIAGAASARWPILGQEWAEWTRYDSSGNAIGGGRIECDGNIYTWGDAGSPHGFTIYSC